MKVANAMDDHMFAVTSNDEIFSEYGAEDGNIAVFKKVCIVRAAAFCIPK
jgi:hypothetical protein